MGHAIYRQRKEASTDLTGREIQIVRLYCENSSEKDIAAKLNVSPHTVSAHLHTARKKLGTHNAFETYQECIRRRLVIPLELSKYKDDLNYLQKGLIDLGHKIDELMVKINIDKEMYTIRQQSNIEFGIEYLAD